MSKLTKQQLEEQYNKLPPVLKDALFSAEIANKMFELGKRNSLTTEEVGRVAEETGHVILGLTRPDNFERELEELLNIDEEEAQKISGEVNKEVFLPLREALKAAHQMEITEPESRGINQELRAGTQQAQPAPSKVIPPTPQPKIETAPQPRPAAPPYFTRPPEQEKKTIPPIDLRPKSAPLPESKFLDKFAASKIVPPPPSPAQISKEILAGKPPAPEPIRPSEPAAPKIPPLDLRGSAPPPHKASPFTKVSADKSAGKPERMREAIFAPPIEPEVRSKNQELRDEKTAAPEKPVEMLKPTEKKMPYGGYDPYREPAE